MQIFHRDLSRKRGLQHVKWGVLMRMVQILLPSEKIVQEFTDALIYLDGDFDLIAGNYILDARSLMGIFSLDLSKSIQLKIEKDTPENMKAICRFIVHQDKELV